MKYDNLLTVILAPDNLWTAAASVVRNRGAAGVDGMRVDVLEAYLHEHWADIRARILAGEYHPQPVRGVEIPKPNGGTRLLGIPTVVDRTIQQAIQQVLSRVWDATFSPFSYGFRPGRNAHQALEQSLAYINAGYQDIIDLDLKSFFDRVNHDILMGLLRRRISDPMLLRLIRRYLQSGMLLGGVVSPRGEGTPQGGPLSPLLSNILLDEFDRELTRRGHRFVRYADDCSIFLRSPSAARRVRASVERWLETKIRLQVNAQKTVICRPIKFTLLGYGFVPSYRKGERGVYRLRIAATSWKRLREKIKRITRKTLPLTLTERIQRLNRLMRGWLHYFKLATGHAKLRELDGWIRNRLRYCIWKQWKRPRRRYRAFLQLGISKSWARRYAWSRKSGWQLSCSMVMKTAVPEALLRKRGYVPFVEYYHQIRASP